MNMVSSCRNIAKIGGLFLLLILLTPSLIFAQKDAEYDAVMKTGRAHAEELSSPGYFGRGYQDNGHLLAANYIAERFKEYGLQPVKEDQEGNKAYFQPFSFVLNRIDSAEVSLNGTRMIIGKDYIMNSRSGGYDASGKVRDLGYGMPFNFKKVKPAKKEIMIIRPGLPKKIAEKEDLKERYAAFQDDFVKINMAKKAQSPAVIVLKEKLTAGLSRMPIDLPVVELLESSAPKKKIKKAEIQIWREFKKVHTQNVAGWVKGKKYPDQYVILSAHYDHLGRQGDAIFYGANDNASGTSMLLTIAEHYAKPENQPDYSMVFIGFGAEEAGLVGSRHYVEQEPLFPLESTRFVMNMDLMANGDEGITAVAGLDFEDEFKRLQELNETMALVPKVKGRRNAPNSDHYFFVTHDVKAFFIYTLGGPKHYHDIFDQYSELKFSKFYEVRKLIMAFLEDLGE